MGLVKIPMSQGLIRSGSHWMQEADLRSFQQVNELKRQGHVNCKHQTLRTTYRIKNIYLNEGQFPVP